MTRMNVLPHVVFVLPTLQLGGAERQALLLARYLVEQNIARVTVAGVLAGPGRAAELAAESAIPTAGLLLKWPELGRTKTMRVALALGWALRRLHPSVILSYCMPSNLLCALSWRYTGATSYVWNQRDLGLDRMIGRLERLAIRGCPRFVANSEPVAEYLIDRMQIAPDKVTVIHNGVELNTAKVPRLQYRQALGIGPQTLAVTMVANLRHPKDHATLLQAWRLVMDRAGSVGRPLLLLLAGRPDHLTAPLKVLAFDLQLCSTVRFLGSVDDIPSLLAATDLGVFSSLSEGSPNGMLECMAAGLAVAGTDIPGIRAVVGEAGAAFLARPSDPQGLADVLLRLLSDDGLRASVGAAMRNRVLSDYSPHGMLTAYRALLQTIEPPCFG